MGQSAYSIAMKEMGDLIGKANLNAAAVEKVLEPINAQLAETVMGVINIKNVFNTKGDGITDDTSAFVSAEGKDGEIVFLDDGTYIVNGITLTKKYIGPGKIKLNGVMQAAYYTNVSTLPKRGSLPNDYYGGDQRRTIAEHFVIESLEGRNNQMDVDHYYNWELIPHFLNFDTYSGNSGIQTKVDANSASGQKVLNVLNTSSFAVGDKVLIAPYTARQETGIVASVQNGVSITLVSNLKFTHTAIDADKVTTGARTMHSAYHTNVRLIGGGDGYGHLYRIFVENQPEAGQYHFFQTATGAMIGGDMYGMGEGVYLTGTEMFFGDNTSFGVKNIATIGDVRTYRRDGNGTAMGQVWLGMLHKSDGAYSADSTIAVGGKWKAALDTVNADLGTTNSAIRMAAGQRIYFDCAATADIDGFKLWGNVIGDTYMYYNSGILDFYLDAVNVLRLGTSGAYFGGAVIAGSDSVVNQGNKIRLNGVGGNTYLQYDGTNVKLYKNGAVVATW